MKTTLLMNSLKQALTCLLFVFATMSSIAQQNIDLTVRYNSSLVRYEVFARPSFTQTNFTWGPSQITIVLPASAPNTILPNLLSFAAGNWGDNSIIYAPAAQPGSDFHGVESSGELMNFVANQEKLLFSFSFPGGCLSGVRIFINGTDPNSFQPGMGGGDFANTIDNGNITDVYNVNYNNNGTNCIDAIDDSAGPIVGLTGGNTGVNVLTNDLMNGSPINPTTVIISSTPTGPLSLDANGNVIVAPNTPAGTYTISYTICEVTSPANCDAATVTVTVTASLIIANNDAYGPTNGYVGNPNVGNALTNDSLNGAPVIASAVTITSITPATPIGANPTVPILNGTTGVVSVPAGTPAGTYTIGYTLCENLNLLTNCDPATITVTVTPAPIIASDDSFGPVNGMNGNPIAGNVFINDSLNGAPVIVTEVSITSVTPANPIGGNLNVPYLNLTTGNVIVPAGTPAGTYTIEYTICENLNLSTNCDPATITITVIAAPIVANDDNYGPTNGLNGNPNVGNALSNDSLNGAPVMASAVTITSITPATPIGANPIVPVLNGTTGVVSVPVGTPAGTYTIGYTLCENLNLLTNCDPAIIIVTVTAAPIVANDDPFGPLNGLNGNPNVGNVLTNDLLNGSPVVATDVTITSVTPATPIGLNPIVPVLNPVTGVVSVPAGTPAGTYTIGYTLCENLNLTTNCDPAIVTIIVSPAPIVANDDDYSLSPVNGVLGGSLGNIYLNDLLNNLALNPSDVTYSQLSNNSSGLITVNTTTGLITVAPGTPAGTYEIVYSICENLNLTTNCDDAIITIVVLGADLTANDDDYSATPINNVTGFTNLFNVLTNDSYNGNTATLSEVILSQLTGNSNFVINPNGSIDLVDFTLPGGIYTITYSICDVTLPTNCDSATVTLSLEDKSVSLNVLLQGGLFGTTSGIMRDDLRVNNVVPLLNPYSAEYYVQGNNRFSRPDNSTAETITGSILSVSGNDAIVDWVFIELRSTADPSVILKTQAALVQRDGNIVGTDGSTKLFFSNLNSESYFVSVKHRNHLGTMTAQTINFVNRQLIFDFTTAAPASVWNSMPMFEGYEMVLDEPSGLYALWAGDVNSNGRVKYVGAQNDQALIFQQVINHPGNTADNYNFNLATPMYANADVNLDAKVKYRGTGNDPIYIFFNVLTKYAGLNTLGLYNYNLFIEQTPN